MARIKGNDRKLEKWLNLKFNGGYGALLCENCGVIIATSDKYQSNIKQQILMEI